LQWRELLRTAAADTPADNVDFRLFVLSLRQEYVQGNEKKLAEFKSSSKVGRNGKKIFSRCCPF
jgi:hypothetical protein